MSKRILIIKLSSLGDVFHALPAATQLREVLGAEMDWVTQPEYVGLVQCMQGVRRVIAFPRRHFLRDAAGFVRDLRREAYDYIFDFQGLLKSALVARLARGARRIGPSYAREGSAWLYDAVAGPLNQKRHAVEEAMDVLDYLQLPKSPPAFPVKFPSQPRAEPSPRIAIVPHSRWITKNWPEEKFAEVGRQLQERLQASLFLVGAPEDQPLCERINRQLRRPAVNTCGRTSLVELGSLLQEMDLVITVDSGPMHMAVALGRPVLGVFGATNPVRTGPYGQLHRVVTVQHLPCRPCHSRTCARGDVACLHELTPEAVVQSAMKITGQT